MENIKTEKYQKQLFLGKMRQINFCKFIHTTIK